MPHQRPELFRAPKVKETGARIRPADGRSPARSRRTLPGSPCQPDRRPERLPAAMAGRCEPDRDSRCSPAQPRTVDSDIIVAVFSGNNFRTFPLARNNRLPQVLMRFKFVQVRLCTQDKFLPGRRRVHINRRRWGGFGSPPTSSAPPSPLRPRLAPVPAGGLRRPDGARVGAKEGRGGPDQRWPVTAG